MNHGKRSNTWICALALAMPMAALADDVLTDAITGGKVSGNFRLRYETVDDPAFAQLGKGLTLRSRLGYETAPAYGFTAGVEFEDIHTVGGVDNYQLPPPPKPNAKGNALIADPEGSELNRAWLRYRGVPKLDLTYGRQKIILDNQRFIGNVGWRQDEQTFDAFSALYTGLPDWGFFYAYVDQVHGITPAFDANTNDHLYNIAYNGFTLGKITAYHYRLDNQDPASTTINPALQYHTNRTSGIRFDGGYILPITVPLKLLYTAEYAKQKTENIAGKEFEAQYQLAELGFAWTVPGLGVVFTPKAGYQLLGSDNGLYGFQTPYATKHSFNGWDDKFLVTPNLGLRSSYGSLAADVQAFGVKVLAGYYHFYADEGKTDFGDEWDFQVLKAFGPRYTVGIKYASYTADKATPKLATVSGSAKAGTANTDADKFWVWAELAF